MKTPVFPIKVESIEHLAEILQDEMHHGFWIALGPTGSFRSRKRIYRMGDHDRYDVCNEIDDSWQELTLKQLAATGAKAKSHIGEAIEKGAFYWEGREDGNNRAFDQRGHRKNVVRDRGDAGSVPAVHAGPRGRGRGAGGGRGHKGRTTPRKGATNSLP